jgi:predicted enzyme related to lactoylglutathione lyase
MRIEEDATMPNDIAHFAIHADDCARARTFYESVFGWTFEPWGPPGFWLITTSPGALRGALQQRREPVSGRGMIGFECTIAVEDVEATAEAIERSGGKVTLQPFLLESVGTLVMFEDTEQNVVGAMQYLEEMR